MRPGGACEPPTGPHGNECCRCTGDECSFLCECAAPETPIATPLGDRAIASLREGDLVYSVNAGRVAVVPLLRAGRRRVDALHAMVHVTLASGVVLRISPRHPTADGRSFADLRRGDAIDHATIVDVALVPYAEPYTYDVLPDSDTGTYFAGGVLIGSTLREAAYPASIVANGGDTR